MSGSQMVWLGILLALTLLPMLSLARAAWRTFVRNEQPEAGGSLGRQFLGRSK